MREASIIGQGIGAALRGLRPIVEVQYHDYIYWAIQTLADDLATLQYRTKGGQKAPRNPFNKISKLFILAVLKISFK